MSKVTVIQHGARHNYAIPKAFADAGLLDRFYTDLCAGRGLGRLADLMHKVGMATPVVSNLSMRKPPANVLSKTSTFDWEGLRLHMLRGPSDREKLIRKSRRINALGKQMMSRGFGEATHILSTFGHGGPFLQAARENGLKIVCDVHVALSTERIVRNEQYNHPGWEPQRYYFGETLARGVDGFDPVGSWLEASHKLISPSEFVKHDLVENFDISPEKIEIVPYVVNPSLFDVINAPTPGRILFPGTAELRKGIHFLAKASSILRQTFPSYEFRVAGNVSEKIRSLPDCSALTFLGRIPRREMFREYEAADVVVLPSLAEGSAGITYEAMGAGIPVITTFEAGSHVRDNIDGIIVPSRDVGALQDAIIRICENRPLRDKMSAQIRTRARSFDETAYASALIKAVLSI